MLGIKVLRRKEKKINLHAPSESFSRERDELISAMLACSVMIFVDPLCS